LNHQFLLVESLLLVEIEFPISRKESTPRSEFPAPGLIDQQTEIAGLGGNPSGLPDFPEKIRPQCRAQKKNAQDSRRAGGQAASEVTQLIKSKDFQAEGCKSRNETE